MGPAFHHVSRHDPRDTGKGIADFLHFEFFFSSKSMATFVFPSTMVRMSLSIFVTLICSSAASFFPQKVAPGLKPLWAEDPDIRFYAVA